MELRERAQIRVRLRGEFDLATANLVADRLRGLRARHATVVLDRDELLDRDTHLPFDAAPS